MDKILLAALGIILLYLGWRYRYAEETDDVLDAKEESS